MKNHYYPAGLALLAAFLFGLNAPLSKILLADASPLFMVAFLYLGAGGGIFLMRLLSGEKTKEAPLSRRELPWTLLMILLDLLAPFLLMCGLRHTTAANASLLFNFEMVATSIIASMFFHEAIGRRIWCAVAVITVASIMLSIDISDTSAWSFSMGSALVLGACCCWGLENNCTRRMSAKSPSQIVILKGFGSGGSALLIALIAGDSLPHDWRVVIGGLTLGFVAYGLSIYYYVKAQRFLGASRTSAYYAAAPFAGVLLSMLILREYPSWPFLLASLLMLLGVGISVFERHSHLHRHGMLTHNHAHCHDDMHHGHVHNPPVAGWHSHEHKHEPCEHTHWHTPDIHHGHSHESL